MPLPLAPLIPFALRLGAVAAAGLAARRFILARSHTGRTDQRAEDALDDLNEGLALHRPADRTDDAQTNAAARLRRTIRFRGQTYELDAGLLARLRLRKTEG
ncbi:MAG: hypothetical protein V4712_16915 [Pseudomonadota bacterium]